MIQKRRLVLAVCSILAVVTGGWGPANAAAQIRSLNIHPEWKPELLIERVRKLTESDSVVSNIWALDEMQLQSAAVSQQPWSGWYWPLQNGTIAAPYATDRYKKLSRRGFGANLRNFKNRMEQFKENQYRFSAEEWDQLAPSEKYDLAVGDTNFTLTRKVWENMKSLEKKPDSWEGICHGWSPAAMLLPRPVRPVDVMTPRGRSIRFYPTDLKALGSYLWANSLAQDFVISEGNRCVSFDGSRNSSGQPERPNCADVYPMVWHLAVTQLVGVQGRSFVFNREGSGEIWNQPFASYTLRSFNPETETFGTLKESVVALGNWKRDPYRRYRSPLAKSVVGYEMKVKYISETDPTHAVDEDESKDLLEEITFTYDLELDAAGGIVGGEWWGSVNAPRAIGNRPDFLWVIPKGMKAWSVADGDFRNSLSWKKVEGAVNYFVRILADPESLSQILTQTTGWGFTHYGAAMPGEKIPYQVVPVGADGEKQAALTPATDVQMMPTWDGASELPVDWRRASRKALDFVYRRAVSFESQGYVVRADGTYAVTPEGRYLVRIRPGAEVEGSADGTYHLKDEKGNLVFDYEGSQPQVLGKIIYPLFERAAKQ